MKKASHLFPRLIPAKTFGPKAIIGGIVVAVAFVSSVCRGASRRFATTHLKSQKYVIECKEKRERERERER